MYFTICNWNHRQLWEHREVNGEIYCTNSSVYMSKDYWWNLIASNVQVSLYLEQIPFPSITTRKKSLESLWCYRQSVMVPDQLGQANIRVSAVTGNGLRCCPTSGGSPGLGQRSDVTPINLSGLLKPQPRSSPSSYMVVTVHVLVSLTDSKNYWLVDWAPVLKCGTGTFSSTGDILVNTCM